MFDEQTGSVIYDSNVVRNSDGGVMLMRKKLKRKNSKTGEEEVFTKKNSRTGEEEDVYVEEAVLREEL